MSKKFKKTFSAGSDSGIIFRPVSQPAGTVGTSSEAVSKPVGTENEPSGETKYASLLASEDLKKVQEELKNELKKSVSERPKGSNKSKKALPIEVKTPFGRGYFVDDLPDGVPEGAKITLYRGKKFMLKSEKA